MAVEELAALARGRSALASSCPRYARTGARRHRDVARWRLPASAAARAEGTTSAKRAICSGREMVRGGDARASSSGRHRAPERGIILRRRGVSSSFGEAYRGDDDVRGDDDDASSTSSSSSNSSSRDVDVASSSSLPPLLRVPTATAAIAVGTPMMAMGLLRSAFNLTDAYWAGKLGATDLSALCYNAFALWMLLLVANVVGTGLQARVSAFVGAGDSHSVSRIVTQGLWGALFAYAALACFAPFAPTLYAAGLGIDLDVGGAWRSAGGKTHLLATLLGSFGMFASTVLDATWRGLGRTRPALCVTALSTILALTLNPALMLGWGPFPKLGIVGAAVGFSAAQCVGAAAHAAALKRVHGLTIAMARPCAKDIWGMVRIGAPLASAGVVFTLVYIAIGRIASACGENYLAAMGLGQKFEALAFTVCEGFRLACATLVGQWIGAGRPREARDAALVIVAMCAACMVPFACVLFCFGPALVATFSSDPSIVAAAGGYLRWNSGALVFLAIEAVAEGCFTGVGNTVPILAIGGAINVLRVPAAYFLSIACGWGISGVWFTLVTSQILKGLSKFAWFHLRAMRGVIDEADADAEKRGAGGGVATS
jgi:putative MATE family efflux protein